jgi:hypothetical protein
VSRPPGPGRPARIGCAGAAAPKGQPPTKPMALLRPPRRARSTPVGSYGASRRTRPPCYPDRRPRPSPVAGLCRFAGSVPAVSPDHETPPVTRWSPTRCPPGGATGQCGCARGLTPAPGGGGARIIRAAPSRHKGRPKMLSASAALPAESILGVLPLVSRASSRPTGQGAGRPGGLPRRKPARPHPPPLIPEPFRRYFLTRKECAPPRGRVAATGTSNGYRGSAQHQQSPGNQRKKSGEKGLRAPDQSGSVQGVREIGSC